VVCSCCTCCYGHLACWCQRHRQRQLKRAVLLVRLLVRLRLLLQQLLRGLRVTRHGP
jgi:hypothetical protein